MEKNPSWKPNGRPFTENLPAFYETRNFLAAFTENLPLYPTMNQRSPDQNPPNLLHHTSLSSKWYLPSDYNNKIVVLIPYLLHPPRSDQANIILTSNQIIKLLITQRLYSLHTSSPKLRVCGVVGRSGRSAPQKNGIKPITTPNNNISHSVTWWNTELSALPRTHLKLFHLLRSDVWWFNHLISNITEILCPQQSDH
jgi:hypothetical protein